MQLSKKTCRHKKHFDRKLRPIKVFRRNIHGLGHTKEGSWSDERAPDAELVNTSGSKMSPEEWGRHVRDLEVEAIWMDTVDEWEGSTAAGSCSEDEEEGMLALTSDPPTAESNSSGPQGMARPWTYEDVPSAHWSDGQVHKMRRYSA
ncbi:hypothetical protein IAQ61_001202 [Plenodomus lingam]|nr:hypothetical protein IAQ61_001202 [Plenodomus lingam]